MCSSSASSNRQYRTFHEQIKTLLDQRRLHAEAANASSARKSENLGNWTGTQLDSATDFCYRLCAHWTVNTAPTHTQDFLLFFLLSDKYNSRVFHTETRKIMIENRTNERTKIEMKWTRRKGANWKWMMAHSKMKRNKEKKGIRHWGKQTNVICYPIGIKL